MAALVVLLLMALFCGTTRSQSCDYNAFLSGFYYEEVNGDWVINDAVGQRGGEPVYSKGVYGWTCYLWKLTDVNGWDGWDAWVTGYALDGSEGYWQFKWGGNLAGTAAWKYWTGSRWAYHETKTRVTCKDTTTDYSSGGGGSSCADCNPGSGASNAAISQPAGSSNVWNATMLEGAHSIPLQRDYASSAVDPPFFGHVEIAAGVAVCALVAVAIVVFIRRKRKGPEPDAAEHVPEKSPTDIAVQIKMGTETVGSVESVTAEDSQSVP